MKKLDICLFNLNHIGDITKNAFEGKPERWSFTDYPIFLEALKIHVKLNKTVIGCIVKNQY